MTVTDHDVRAVDPALAWSGIRVLDISEHRSGQYAARLMADAGADVVLLEPVAGSELRRTGPFWADGRRPDDSITFWHLNAGKRSVTLDLAQATGRRLLGDLLGGADVALALRGTPATDAVEKASRGDLVACWVGDFPESSSYAHWTGSELVHQAMSGVMYENGQAAERPLYGTGHRSYVAAGTAAYIATAAALLAQRPTGETAVYVSEVAPAMNHCTGTHYWYNGTYDRRGDQISPTMMLRCRDGWVVTFPSAARWVGTCRAFGAAHLADAPEYADETSRLDRWPAIQADLQASCAALSCGEVLAAAERENAIITRVANPHELWDDEHLRARGFWQSVDDGERPRPALGPAFMSAGGARPTRRRAPLLGEHTLEVLADVGVSEDEYGFLRNAGMA